MILIIHRVMVNNTAMEMEKNVEVMECRLKLRAQLFQVLKEY